MKKILSLILTFAVCLSCVGLVGCGKKYDYVIGINRFAPFTALRLAQDGFKEEMNTWAKENGKTISFVETCANGDPLNIDSVTSGLISNSKVKLIYAIATPSAISTANATSDIPVVYTAVSNPEGENLVGLPNVTGTSDYLDSALFQQIELVTELQNPNKKIGLFYCKSEKNSEFQINEAKKLLLNKGISEDRIDIKYFIDQTEITMFLDTWDDIGVLFLPTDNALANNMTSVLQSMSEKHIPIVAGDAGMVYDGGLVTIALDYKKLGAQSARMAIQILTGDKKPNEIPFAYSENGPEFILMEDRASEFGISLDKVKDLKLKFKDFIK